MKAAFLFDPDRCTACEACRVACGIENGEGRDTGWRQLTTLNAERHPWLPTLHLSMACNHCETAACMDACPAGAYRRDPVTGAVLLDDDRCIGCRYCSWVCPYDAPRFDARRGVMTKCTFCSPRLAQGDPPACAESCPTGALRVGPRSQSSDEPTYAGVGRTGLGPALTVTPPRFVDRPRQVAGNHLEPPEVVPPQRRITPASEWSLLVFTLVLPSLVAWFGAGVGRADRRPPAWGFLGLGLGVLALSVVHLGRPQRAWRAVLGLRGSWLSREVLLATAFVALAAASLLLPDSSRAVAWAALATGVALCVAIDRVYRAVPRPGGGDAHSADALGTGVLLLGVIGGVPWLAWAAAALKLMLLTRRWRAGRPGLEVAPAVARVLLLGLACVPALGLGATLVAALAGEVLDRGSFYAGLEPTSPALRMVEEAQRRLAAAS